MDGWEGGLDGWMGWNMHIFEGGMVAVVFGEMRGREGGTEMAWGERGDGGK
jgi:hypothetical protein